MTFKMVGAAQPKIIQPPEILLQKLVQIIIKMHCRSASYKKGCYRLIGIKTKMHSTNHF